MNANDYTSISTVEALGDVDPELAEILKTYVKPERNPDLNVARGIELEGNTKRAVACRNDAVLESTQEIPMRDGYMSEIRVFTPKQKAPNGSPLIMLYFGGGFMFGNNVQLAVYATFFSALYSAVVVLPSYRLAPENPYPAAPHDAWDNFQWVADNATSLGADTSVGFILGGVSAGGNLSAVVAQKSIDEGFSPKLTGLWLSIPALLTHAIVPEADKHLFVSREQNADAPGLNTKRSELFFAAYAPDETSQLYSPFNAKKPHKGMPSTYLQVCGLDPLRDDGLIYERALRKAGVKTRLDVYPGVPHGHVVDFPTLKSSGKFHVDAVIGVGQLLGKEVDRAEVGMLLMGLAAKSRQ